MNLFDLDELSNKLKSLEAKTMQDGFWNSKDSNKVLQEMKSCKEKISKFTNINSEYNNLFEMNELLFIDEDLELTNELIKNTKKLERDVEKLEIETLLSR